jgi:filamentous hemagglutinin
LKRSERSLAYQEQISGLPRGFAVDLNGVSYDGCRITDGTMLDAKAQGYAWALDETYTVRSFYTGFARLIDQAQRQVIAANGRPIEWYFAEKPAADYMAGVLGKSFPQIKVIWQPPLPRRTP